MFYATCAVAALYDLAQDVLDRPVRTCAVSWDAIQLCIVSLLVWLAGTYPLQDVWPCPNVAKPTDVSSDPPFAFISRVSTGAFAAIVERVHHAPMPGNSADLWSWFSFVEPLFKVSNAGRVNDEDVWTLSPFFTHRNLLRKYLQYTSE